MIAGSRPGKRASISAQREWFRISTLRRSEQINPVSRRTLKRLDKDDLGKTRSRS